MIDYKEWLETAKAELFDLQGRKDAIRSQRAVLDLQEKGIDAKIDAMAQTVSALAPVVPDSAMDLSLLNILASIGKVVVEVGMKDRIRAILQAAAPKQLSAVEVRKELETTGFYLGGYANALATIYTTLNRLVESDEITEVQTADGKRYQMKFNFTVPLAIPGGFTIPNRPERYQGYTKSRYKRRANTIGRDNTVQPGKV